MEISIYHLIVGSVIFIIGILIGKLEMIIRYKEFNYNISFKEIIR